jgi:hypothetical protein
MRCRSSRQPPAQGSHQPADSRQPGVEFFGGIPVVAVPGHLAVGVKPEMRGAADHLRFGLSPLPTGPVAEFPDQQRALLVDDALEDDETRFGDLPEQVREDVLDRLQAADLIERVLEAGVGRIILGEAGTVSGLSPSKKAISASTARWLFIENSLTYPARRRSNGK